MNIISKLTLTNMRLNRRRTLVTILGVVISVAMITAVTTIVASFLELFRQQTISETGLWHAQFHDVPYEKLQILAADENVESLDISADGQFAMLPRVAVRDRPYLYLEEHNAEGFLQLPIAVKEGRLPQQPGEIIVSDSLSRIGRVDWKVGDTVELELGTRYEQAQEGDPVIRPWHFEATEEEYLTTERRQPVTIVGIMDPQNLEYNWYGGYLALGIADPAEGECYQVKAALKKVDRSVYTWMDQMAQTLEASQCEVNNTLLAFYGISNEKWLLVSVGGITGVLAVMIAFGAVSLIYNAFSISLTERSRQLGMLASVGATARQKSWSVFFEGLVVAAAAIPLGLAAGFGGMAITFACINPLLHSALAVEMGLSVKITLLQVVIASAASLIMIMISAWIPARRASRISPIDAIRQTNDIQLKAKMVRTSPLTRWVFGFSAELGLKNMKRNGSRYRITLFSLVVSILLFLSASGFTYYMNASYQLVQSDAYSDINVEFWGNDWDQVETTAQKAAQLPGVDAYTMTIQGLNCRIPFDPDILEIPVMEDEEIEKGETFPVALIGLPEQDYAAYARLCGVDGTLQEGMTVIVQNEFVLKRGTSFSQLKMTRCQAGDVLPMTCLFGDESIDMPVTVEAVAKLTPSGDLPQMDYIPGYLTLVTSRENYRALYERLQAPTELIRFELDMDCEDDMLVQEGLYAMMEKETSDTQMGLDNRAENARQADNMATIISVFIYGFVILIGAIAAANIFNTLSTSVALRRREFAMLKSVGMTPGSFTRMICFESLFYGIQSLGYGLPLSVGVLYLMYHFLELSFEFAFSLPWGSMALCIAGVLTLVTLTMLYSVHKVNQGNLVNALKEENL